MRYAVAAVCLVLLVACQQPPTYESRYTEPSNESGPSPGFPTFIPPAAAELRYDATSKANSESPPLAADSGQPFASFGVAPFEVAGGYLVHDSVKRNNAAFLQAELPRRVVEIGCLVHFPSQRGAVALVIPAASWDGDVGRVQAGLHLVVYGGGAWHVSNWTGSSESPIYANSSINPTINVGDVAIRVRVDYANATAMIRLPDGSEATITDILVGNMGNFAVWELFENSPFDPPARIRMLWAESAAESAAEG